MSKKKMRISRKSGSALVPALVTMMILAIAAITYISHADSTLLIAQREGYEVQTEPLCEAAEQSLLENLWLPFKTNQNFITMDSQMNGSSTSNPTETTGGTIPSVGAFSAGVINYYIDPTDPNYGRYITIRCVGWVDTNGNGQLDPGEPSKTVDVTVEFALKRSPVFDYAYFANNYGWFTGFNPNNLYVNGDCRANGNFNISSGSPSFNGSLYASQSNNLIPPAQGYVTGGPYKDDLNSYLSMFGSNKRVRQGYQESKMGAYGSSSWQQWMNTIYDSNGQIFNNQIEGSVIADSRGVQTWAPESYAPASGNFIDTTPTSQVPMPDLNNISNYETLSQTYVDTKAQFSDGTPNPNYNKGAYVETWVPSGSSGSYQTVSTNGVVNGSAVLIGSTSHPIIIHGPVTFTQDAVLKGVVSGQGTIYTGRNVHVVGSLVYADPPDFSGSDPTAIQNQNDKADILGLAAEGSVIVGDTSQFGSNPLQYMEPPFTQGRIDDYGNYIPPYNAMDYDSTGHRLYQSVYGNSYIHSISSSVDQIDAIMYSNNTIGGNFGTDGSHFYLNGSMICKDDATVMWSSREQMNYDGRIRENSPNGSPLIDLNLPRSPQIGFSSWQDRGFNFTP